MEISECPSDTGRPQEKGHLRCLGKAIDCLQSLLIHDASLKDYARIHAAKTILYVAIEQMGMQVERLHTVQRMLRELLSIVTSQYQSPGHDKQVGLQILQELRQRSRSL